VAPDHVGNPDLEAERAWSADTGFDLHPFPGVRVGASAYIRDAADLIDWARVSPDEPYVTRNVHSARFRGIEADVELAEILGTKLVARGAWVSVSSSSEPGVESKYALRPLVETVALSADRTIYGPLRLGIRGARERRAEETSRVRIDARGSLDFGGVRLWSDLRNALDEPYLDISRQPAAGRSLLIGLEWRLGQ
jgi:outer membrane cobalamin receptor